MSTSKSNSGSGSLEMSSDLASKATRDGSGPPLPDSNSADLGTSASASSSSGTPSKRHKPDRDEKIAHLEDEITRITADLRVLSGKLYAATERRDRLLEKEERTSIDAECLIAVEKNISTMEKDKDRMEKREDDMRKDKNRLVAEVADLKAEMSGLRNPKELVYAPVPVQGM